MNKLTMTTAVMALGVACLGIPAFTQGEHAEGQERVRAQDMQAATKGDLDMLYKLVRQARADVDALRKQASLPPLGREGRGEHAEGGREGRGGHGEGGREGRGEHGEGGREGGGEHGEGGREGGGEHGEGGEKGEEGGKRLAKNQTWDEARNGAHLLLAYNAASQSFKGAVQNKTKKTLSDVRVEVHLSNGVELGPTKRTDLKPGAILPVELSAAGQKFTWWTTHPEHGSEEGHGPGHEGERGEGDGRRPKNAALRPLYNELLLLRREIKMVTEGLEKKKR